MGEVKPVGLLVYEFDFHETIVLVARFVFACSTPQCSHKWDNFKFSNAWKISDYYLMDIIQLRVMPINEFEYCGISSTIACFWNLPLSESVGKKQSIIVKIHVFFQVTIIDRGLEWKDGRGKNWTWKKRKVFKTCFLAFSAEWNWYAKTEIDELMKKYSQNLMQKGVWIS